MNSIEPIYVGMKNQLMRNLLFATLLALSTKNQIRLSWFQKINSGPNLLTILKGGYELH